MRRSHLLAMCCVFCGAAFRSSMWSDAAFATDSPVPVPQLLAEADRARGHLDQGLEYQVNLECTNADSPHTVRSFLVRSKGEGAAALTLSPVEYRDDLYLVNGRYIWNFKTQSRQPIAITLQSRLTGLASVGDIVAMGIATIYTGVLEGHEQVNGRDCLRVALTAKKDQPATYQTGVIWLDSVTHLARQLEFLSLANRPIKTVTFAYETRLKKGKKASPFISAAKIVDSLSECDVNYLEPKYTGVEQDEFDVDKVAAKRLEKSKR